VSEVHTRRTGREGDVDPIVDDHACLGWRRPLDSSRNKIGQHMVIEVGLSYLDKVDPGSGGSPDQIDKPVETAR
jgi:hypothetical protein